MNNTQHGDVRTRSGLGATESLPARAVLVVDDDAPFREALRDLLEERGLVVRIAVDAYEGARALREMSFDVVFTDIKMPGGGFLVLDHVRQLQPHTPVILITGSPSDEWTARAKHDGAFAYLTKPVGKDQIVDVLRRALERHRFAVRGGFGAGERPSTR